MGHSEGYSLFKHKKLSQILFKVTVLLLHGVLLSSAILKRCLGGWAEMCTSWLINTPHLSLVVYRHQPSDRGKAPLPRQLLQMIGAYLETADLAAARLVCKEWRGLLSEQIGSVQLPTNVWQYSSPGQLVQLYRLLAVFRHLRDVKLTLQASQPVDSWSVERAMDTLRANMGSLRSLELSSIMQPQHWTAVLGSLQCLAPQLTALSLQDICWPPPNTLHLVSQLTGLRQLHIRSPHFSRLEVQHLLAIGHLTQLQELALSFRTVDGTAHAPLSLDPLSSLVKLTALDVQYTGLLELASAVVFCGPSALASLHNLQQISVGLVPLPCLSSLRQLPLLRQLNLHQAQPLTGSQCVSLSCCQQLQRVCLGSVQWADIAKLAPLTSLELLCLQIWQPARGTLPGATAGKQLLQLKPLEKLKSLKLRGQCEVCAELLGKLAGHWRGLTALDLCCVMPDGTQGLQLFTALRSLKVQPYKWDVWSSEPPVLLYPAQLPPTLTSFEGLDVWCMDEVPSPASSCSSDGNSSSSGSSSGSGGMKQSNSYCSFTGLWTRASSVGANLCNMGGSCSSSNGASSSSAAEAVSAVVGAAAARDADGDEQLLHTAYCIESTTAVVAATLQAGAQGSEEQLQLQCAGDGLVMCTPSLKRLVLRSTSPFDRKLHMLDLSRCNQLEYLELHHSQLNQCHLQHIAASCPSSLRSLKLVAVDDGARIRASGLTILTRLSALTNLSVHAHERAINRNVRRAISTMSQLRSLTLLTSPDYPTNFARSLACLTQLTNLMVLRVGLGFGALDALRRLGTHVSRALPHCSYEMLTDVCD